ncbi:hypothetical protein NEF87_004085 [Candidatus Lokiarchaeum ossiferum]|uniref:Uncharacterized protein n=1 Tax=Candidatus Lokiarchaeum ossiferum TaxID=2951803 RepID=A0ABY6HW94_9ARCH|nr:hypothetical protein NEF87_004085 [Candidatus Lokiarchaeum sp. B-35]
MDWAERKKQERLKRMQLLQAKKKEEERMLTDANDTMALAKNAFSKNKFSKAAELYIKSSKIFETLGWTQQAEMLLKEASDMEIKKKELEEKTLLQEEKLRLEKEHYEIRAQEILAEKERLKQLEEELRNRPSPELQLKIDRAVMIEEKAKNLELKGKTAKALARYEYLIELFHEIGYDSQKIKPIQEKINSLKN